MKMFNVSGSVPSGKKNEKKEVKCFYSGYCFCFIPTYVYLRKPVDTGNLAMTILLCVCVRLYRFSPKLVRYASLTFHVTWKLIGK